MGRCTACDTPAHRLIWVVMFHPDGLCLRCWAWAQAGLRERRWTVQENGGGEVGGVGVLSPTEDRVEV